MHSKKIVSGLVFGALASVMAPAANAFIFHSPCCFNLNCPYIGFELIQTNLNYQQGYGKGIFYKNPIEWNVFGGLYFTKHFGAEIGYEAAARKGTQVLVGQGNALPGNVVMGAGQFTNMESTSQLTSPYAGLFGEYKFWRINWQALIGLSICHFRARTAITANQTGTFNQAAYTSSTRNYAQTKVVPMFKLAGMYNFTKCLAARASFLYRNTSQIKPYAQGGGSQVKLRDTVGVGVGLVYYFR